MGSDIHQPDSFVVLGFEYKEPAVIHFPVCSFQWYSYFKRLYWKRVGTKKIGTKANLVIAAAAGACTVIVTQPLDTASSRMQTCAFGKSKSLWQTLAEGSWSEAFDSLGISRLLTSNPAIQYTVKGKLTKNDDNASPEALSAFSALDRCNIKKRHHCLNVSAIRCKVMIQAPDPSEDPSKKAKRRSQKSLTKIIHQVWTKEGH